MGTLSPSGYNLREGGGSHGKHSEESKQKNRDAHIGKKHTDKTKKKMSESQSGKTLSEEHKQKLSEMKRGEKHPMYGKKHSEETKQKRNDALRGDKNNRSKKTYQYDLEGNYIQSFGSCGEAGLYMKKSTSKISLCACGKRKSAYGFKWSYDEIITKT
jgi:group I intron endonuclease